MQIIMQNEDTGDVLKSTLPQFWYTKHPSRLPVCTIVSTSATTDSQTRLVVAVWQIHT